MSAGMHGRTAPHWWHGRGRLEANGTQVRGRSPPTVGSICELQLVASEGLRILSSGSIRPQIGRRLLGGGGLNRSVAVMVWIPAARR